MRDHFRRRTAGITGKATVQVTFVKGRGPHAGMRGWIIGHGQNNQTALDILRHQLPAQFAQSDLAFVFIAMIAGDNQGRGSGAVLEHHDGHGDPAICGAVNGIGQAQEAVLGAVLVKIYFALRQAVCL